MHRLTRADLTDENRLLIAAEAQAQLEAQPDTHGRRFTVTLTDGREVTVRGISAADPVITDGEHFIHIQKPAIINRGFIKWMLPGGMKDVVNGVVETPIEAAIREAHEETNFVVQPDDVCTVLGTSLVNPMAVRFYDAKHDHHLLDEAGQPTGHFMLAEAHGLAQDDAFIMDSIGVKIFTLRDLSKFEIAPKGMALSDEQKNQKSKGLLLQASDDAALVGVLAARDLPRLVAAGHMAMGFHYQLLCAAQPDRVPPLDAVAAEQMEKFVLPPRPVSGGRITAKGQHL